MFISPPSSRSILIEFLLKPKIILTPFLLNTLKMNGFDVKAANRGEEVLKLYKEAKDKKEPFDVVIMDLTVPFGMGGKECIKRLKDIDPDVTAIVMSGYSDDPVMSNYKEYGFKERIKKPFSLEEFKEKIQKITAK